MATAGYLDRIPESKRWGGWLNTAKNAGVITDAQVAANATVTLLAAAVLSAAAAAQLPMAIQVKKALLRAVSMGQIPETHAVTTVAALVALGDAGTTTRQAFFG